MLMQPTLLAIFYNKETANSMVMQSFQDSREISASTEVVPWFKPVGILHDGLYCGANLGL